LTFLAAVLHMGFAQPSTNPDFIVSSCRRSQIQHDLPAASVFQKFLRFSAIGSFTVELGKWAKALSVRPVDRTLIHSHSFHLSLLAVSIIDQDGKAVTITDSLATKCGYKISQDSWGNITFRVSLYSCYVQIQNETYFTVPVMIEISSRPDMVGAISYLKNMSCPYYWSPREILCETNYMEVSVRRKIPVIAEGMFKNEPEDWASAFGPAVDGLMSIWQVVFHKSSTQKTTMLIDAALKMGYGINTTESRTLLRSPYNATEAITQKVDGVTYSTIRATLFYKQRWFIYLIDNAASCPVDDVVFTPGWITWTIPKNIFPLLIGAKAVQKSSYQFGLDLLNITNEQILASNYAITDSVVAITVKIPIGANGGYYKSHVVNLEHGVKYNIKPFLENFWTDDGWGITRYTIIKDITTPFERRPPVITNDTVPSTLIFNITVGTFLPDIQLINITIGGGVTQTVEQAISHGYPITSMQHPNGSFYFVVKVPFLDPQISQKILPDGVLFTLNLTFGFNIIPYGETFTTPATIECFMPHPIVGPCGQKDSQFTIAVANINQNWNVYIQNTLVTTSSSLPVGTNQNLTVQIPAQSDLIMYEASGAGVSAVVPLNIKDGTGATVYSFAINCDITPSPVVCLPEGIIQVTVKKVVNIPDMDMSLLRLRDAACQPARFDTNNAYFSFYASSCRTSRTFVDNLMMYHNEIAYYSASGNPLFIMNVTCNYTTNGTIVAEYGYENNPTPSAVSAMASLVLVLRLSKDIAYKDFYGDADYPVVKYLREPLYFEVELLYSSDSQLELFLDTCWATTSPEMNSSPSWLIVTNSCEYGEQYQTVFRTVTADSRVKFPSHFKRFEVKTFNFMEADKPYTGAIYFHCDVIVCDASNLSADLVCSGIGSCIPAKQRMGRSVNTGDNFRSISSRAVFLLASTVESYALEMIILNNMYF
ncbi:PREDICTED: uncharacterized protein LOC108801009, partial [Nanorana parkeri]|uniref:uncharacterized protein LOC108801009 n=1 Tax=Nanorana parkeri TaxID=125878 RepID=UPI000854433E